jgi:hypothetical protein
VSLLRTEDLHSAVVDAYGEDVATRVVATLEAEAGGGLLVFTCIRHSLNSKTPVGVPTTEVVDDLCARGYLRPGTYAVFQKSKTKEI